MITVTNNYFADLNAAIAIGIFPASSKPKKAALYEAIAFHNKEDDERALSGLYGLAAMYATQERYGIIPADRQSEVKPEVAVDDEPANGSATAIQVGDRVRRATKEAGYRGPGKVIIIDRETLRALVQWETNRTWYATDRLIVIERNTEPAITTPKVEAIASTKKKGRKTPVENLDNLKTVAADVGMRGFKTVAKELETSIGRLRKLVKAHQTLMENQDIFEGFMAEQISYSFLCEMAVRRDGLDQLRTKLAA